MSSRTLRRSLAPCLLAGAVALAGCGQPASDQAVRTGSAGQEPAASDPPTSTSQPAATSSTEAVTSTTGPQSSAPATTVIPPTTEIPSTTVIGSDGEPSASAVDGLSVDDVKAAALAPMTATARRATGPVVEPLTLPSGVRVWRVRIPGHFPARSARVDVLVGDRTIGTGIVTPALDALVAITTDQRGLTAGAAVSYRWEGQQAVSTGPLGVAR